MSAQRSVQMTLTNQTSQNLQLSSANPQHGIWNPQPPTAISANSSATWEIDSQGFATGAQATVVYAVQGGSSTLVTMSVDDPFVGSDDFPPATVNNPAFSVNTNVVAGGNNAALIYPLTQS